MCVSPVLKLLCLTAAVWFGTVAGLPELPTSECILKHTNKRAHGKTLQAFMRTKIGSAAGLSCTPGVAMETLSDKEKQLPLKKKMKAIAKMNKALVKKMKRCVLKKKGGATKEDLKSTAEDALQKTPVLKLIAKCALKVPSFLLTRAPPFY